MSVVSYYSVCLGVRSESFDNFPDAFLDAFKRRKEVKTDAPGYEISTCGVVMQSPTFAINGLFLDLWKLREMTEQQWCHIREDKFKLVCPPMLDDLKTFFVTHSEPEPTVESAKNLFGRHWPLQN